jgi:hypothetical protein
VRKVAITILLGAALAASVAPAAQGSCGSTVTPGNSEVDQYTETVPGACGHEDTSPASPGGNRGGGSDSSAPPAPAATVEQLQSAGPDGAGAAVLVEGDAANGSGHDGGDDNGGQQGSTTTIKGTPAPESEDGSVLSGLARTVTGSDDSGGLGIVLPLVLAASLVGALAYFVRRRDRTPQT